jgi:hypothetical protein
MEWKIVNKKLDMSNVDIYVETSPVVKYFFAEIQPANLPMLLSQVISNKMYSEGLASIRFFHELDWEDIDALSSIGGIKDGEVYISHDSYGDIVIKDVIFYQILLEYTSKVYTVNESTGKFSESWGKEIMTYLYGLGKLLQDVKSREQ